MAQLASALAWGARGRQFESGHPDESAEFLYISMIADFSLAELASASRMRPDHPVGFKLNHDLSQSARISSDKESLPFRL